MPKPSPDPRELIAITRILRRRYLDYAHNNKSNPLSELLFIICSIQTDEAKYDITYKSLRRAFPTFESLQRAQESQIADAIVAGGLARQKAKAISCLLDDITSRLGSPSLTPLRQMPADECEEFLVSLPGVGVKTARCVMMYSLGHRVLPVDTHCWRIARRLGWVRPTRPDRSCSPRDMDRLQAKIPEAMRFSLHVNMVSLGREICVAQRPRCSECPISDHCKRIGA